MDKTKGRLFILSAPSGAGKSVVTQRLLSQRPELVFSVSATTRAPRPEESNGVSYYFISREKFMLMIVDDEFLEFAEYIGEMYGTPKKPIFAYLEEGRDVLLDIEVQGAKQVFAKMPEAISIFVIPPSMEELERRLRGRGTDTEEKLQARLERARQEIAEKDLYDYVLVNNSINTTADEILAIIDKR